MTTTENSSTEAMRAALPNAKIESKWQTLNRNDDSWQPFPWVLLAQWAFEEGRKSGLSQPSQAEQRQDEQHSCSYHCDRPECIKAQRDELRERMAQSEPVRPGEAQKGKV